jgi:hypothetical protein
MWADHWPFSKWTEAITFASQEKKTCFGLVSNNQSRKILALLSNIFLDFQMWLN